MVTDPRNPLEERKTDVDGVMIASFNELIDAAIWQWPSQYLYVIFNILKFRDDTDILYCFVRIPPELKEAILQIANKKNKKNPKDPKARAKLIFKKLAAIFTRLAEME